MLLIIDLKKDIARPSIKEGFAVKQHFVSALLLGTVVIGSPALAQSQSDLEDGTIVVNGQRPRNEASAGTKSAVPIAAGLASHAKHDVFPLSPENDSVSVSLPAESAESE